MIIRYNIIVKKPISITVEIDNLRWVKGQAARTPRGSASEVIDRLISEARLAGHSHPGAIRSVVGTIHLPDDDSLERPDPAVKAMFDRSVSRPLLVREGTPRARARRG